MRPGGAEKMAINLANSLANRIEFSGICATRREGLLKIQINSGAHYIFLEKKSTLDLKAILKLHKYVIRNRIEILHTHGTSFFLGVIIKLINPKIKLIWHDHLGSRSVKSFKDFPLLYLCSKFFNGIIVVNKELLVWVKINLLCKKTIFIPNFLMNEFDKEQLESPQKRKSELISLVCVANLKKPKNHLNLVKAFKIVVDQHKNVELKLIGKNYEDIYQEQIHDFLMSNDLESKVILLGEQNNILKHLRNSSIGILASDSEGLSMAILEYGMAGLPVIITDVGECPDIIGSNGKIVKVNDPEDLAENILYYINNENSRKADAQKFRNIIIDNYTEDTVIPELLLFYNAIGNT
ncbi:glycosyltransferase family 4 protein [Gillisia hiemivivida]|uniref:glycosyltransferase family 4 protein n=1 Tax=Gillisia hiemivivida TaxID=291190 RepID=UPI0039F047A7